MTARTVRVCSYHMKQGELPVYDGVLPVAFVLSKDSWLRVDNPTRVYGDEGNELWEPTKLGLLRQLFDVMLSAPDGAETLLVAVRTYSVLNVKDDKIARAELGSDLMHLLQYALVGLPDVELVDFDRRALEFPSWIQLEASAFEDLMLVESVMGS